MHHFVNGAFGKDHTNFYMDGDEVLKNLKHIGFFIAVILGR
jgi:hypothetical protein